MNYDNNVTIAFEAVLDEIENIANILKRIATDSIETNDDYDHALAIIEKGKHVNALRDKVSELQKEWNSLFAALAVLMPGEEKHPRAELPPKVKGKLRREAFVEKLNKSGIKLINFEGVIYKTRTGKIVGIASATERKKRPGHWFLGLPMQDYAFIVLLCEKVNGKLLSFVFPKDFLQDYIHHFSHSGGNYKFHLVTKGDKHYIRIPGIGKVDASKYLENIELLR